MTKPSLVKYVKPVVATATVVTSAAKAVRTLAHNRPAVKEQVRRKYTKPGGK